MGGRVGVDRALRRHPAEHGAGEELPLGVEALGQVQHEGLVLPVCTVLKAGVLPVHVHAVKAVLIAHGDDGIGKGLPLGLGGGGGGKSGLQDHAVVAPAAHGQEDLDSLLVGGLDELPGRLGVFQGAQTALRGGDGKGVVEMGHLVIGDLGEIAAAPIGDIAHHFFLGRGAAGGLQPGGDQGERGEQGEQQRQKGEGACCSSVHDKIPAFLKIACGRYHREHDTMENRGNALGEYRKKGSAGDSDLSRRTLCRG